MKKLIYTLEDDNDIREILYTYFTEQELKVRTFDSATSFKEGRFFPVPDLYLMDVNLPDGNGIDLAKELRKDKRSEHTPVVLMSAHLTDENFQPNDSIGFVEKPFDLDNLYDKISNKLY